MWLTRPEITITLTIARLGWLATLSLNLALALPSVILGSYLEEKFVCSWGARD